MAGEAVMAGLVTCAKTTLTQGGKEVTREIVDPILVMDVERGEYPLVDLVSEYLKRNPGTFPVTFVLNRIERREASFLLRFLYHKRVPRT